MPRHSKEKIEMIKSLRKEGLNIIDIMNKLFLSKTTVWHHIQNIELSTKHRKVLVSNQGGSRVRKERYIKKAREKAKELIESSYRFEATIMSMLYGVRGIRKIPALSQIRIQG